MAEAFVLMIVVSLGLYFFVCLVQFKICEKFGIGSLFECCIPVYNAVLLCRCADISGWNILWLFLPAFLLQGNLAWLASLIAVIYWVVLWGRIAERLGRSFWQYGLGCTFLLGIPVLVLAFGPAQPASAESQSKGQRRDEKRIAEPVYKPLPLNDQVVSVPQGTPVYSAAGIYCCYGEMKGNTIKLPLEGVMVGRDPGCCQIVLSSNEVSRTHASIRPYRSDSRAVEVSDLQSTNGTFRQVPGSSPKTYRWEQIVGRVVLQPGERFRFGKDVAEFEVR